MLWALPCERKRTSLEFGLCCLVPLEGLLAAQGRCLGPEMPLSPSTGPSLCFPQ